MQLGGVEGIEVERGRGPMGGVRMHNRESREWCRFRLDTSNWR